MFLEARHARRPLVGQACGELVRDQEDDVVQVLKQVTPEIWIGDQPSASDLEQLKERGIVGVVNLRNPGEPDQPLSPFEEGDLATALGLKYLHYGVGGKPLDPVGVSTVCEFLCAHTQDSQQVLVHCRKGGRALALVLLHLAKQQGWTADEIAHKCREHGLQLDPALLQMVEGYLRSGC